VDFGECNSGNENSETRNENSETRNENSATREKLLQLEMDFRDINIHNIKIIAIF
jgi:hypothetical protein